MHVQASLLAQPTGQGRSGSWLRCRFSSSSYQKRAFGTFWWIRPTCMPNKSWKVSFALFCLFLLFHMHMCLCSVLLFYSYFLLIIYRCKSKYAGKFRASLHWWAPDLSGAHHWNGPREEGRRTPVLLEEVPVRLRPKRALCPVHVSQQVSA